jgi:NAD(P)-dependent dehydrogenase (short-subunit alcohol dehydrogenase family)
LRLTALLARQLAKGAKLVLITSRMGSIADNTSGGYYGYRMSKAALNAAGRSLAHRRTHTGHDRQLPAR